MCCVQCLEKEHQQKHHLCQSKLPSHELAKTSCSFTKPAEAPAVPFASFPVFSFPLPHNLSRGRVTRSSRLLRVAEGSVLPAQQGTATVTQACKRGTWAEPLLASFACPLLLPLALLLYCPGFGCNSQQWKNMLLFKSRWEFIPEGKNMSL